MFIVIILFKKSTSKSFISNTIFLSNELQAFTLFLISAFKQISALKYIVSDVLPVWIHGFNFFLPFFSIETMAPCSKKFQVLKVLQKEESCLWSMTLFRHSANNHHIFVHNCYVSWLKNKIIGSLRQLIAQQQYKLTKTNSAEIKKLISFLIDLLSYNG